MSPALQRARRPFLVKNAVTGTLIAAFAVSVWAYSISAVKQDNFDDIDAEALLLPEEERRRRISIEDQFATSTSGPAVVAPDTGVTVNHTSPSVLPSLPDSRPTPGWFPSLKPTILERLAVLRHPQQGNILVWDAPPVERLGKLGDRTTASGPKLV